MIFRLLLPCAKGAKAELQGKLEGKKHETRVTFAHRFPSLATPHQCRHCRSIAAARLGAFSGGASGDKGMPAAAWLPIGS